MRAVQEGQRAAVVFVVQREDAERLVPHDENDPAFGRALRQAARAGVELSFGEIVADTLAQVGATSEEAVYVGDRGAIDAGLLKIMSKMRISVISSNFS